MLLHSHRTTVTAVITKLYIHLNIYTYTKIHFIPILQAHKRRNQTLPNLLRLLPRHLNNAQQLLDTNIQPSSILRPEASLLKHLHRTLKFTWIRDKLDFLDDMF